MSTNQQVLIEIAKRVGSKVLNCEDYDPNVCIFSPNSKSPAKIIVTSGQPFIKKASYKRGNQRIRFEANSNYLKIQIPSEIDIDPIAINQTDRIQFLVHAGEMFIKNCSWAVFTKDGSLRGKHAALLQKPDFRKLVSEVNLMVGEGIHLYRNGLSVYLLVPSIERGLYVANLAADFLSSFGNTLQLVDLVIGTLNEGANGDYKSSGRARS